MITKRLAAPKFWKIPRKVRKFVISPDPGPHTKDTSVPLGLVIRDYLGLADTLREVKRALSTGLVKVDGIVRKNYRFPVGIMDVLQVGDEYHRMLIGKHGLYLKEISQQDALRKPLRIKRKMRIKGGRLQYTFHDGRNLVTDEKYSTNSTLLVSLPSINVMDYFEMREGYVAYITGGVKRGVIGTIKEIKIVRSFMPNRIVVETDDGEVETTMDYIFVVGKNKPSIEV